MLIQIIALVIIPTDGRRNFRILKIITLFGIVISLATSMSAVIYVEQLRTIPSKRFRHFGLQINVTAQDIVKHSDTVILGLYSGAGKWRFTLFKTLYSTFASLTAVLCMGQAILLLVFSW